MLTEYRTINKANFLDQTNLLKACKGDVRERLLGFNKTFVKAKATFNVLNSSKAYKRFMCEN